MVQGLDIRSTGDGIHVIPSGKWLSYPHAERDELNRILQMQITSWVSSSVVFRHA